MPLIRVSKNIMLESLMSRFFIEFIFPHSGENFAREHSVLFFGKFPLLNKFLDKKLGVSRVFVKRFCLTVPKKLIEEPFRV